MSDEEEEPRHGLTVAQRIGLAERDLRAHSRSLTEIVNSHRGLEGRISKVEEWQVSKQIAEAREDERDKALYDRLGRIEESIREGIAGVELKVGKITGFGSRIFWIAMGTVIPAIVLVTALTIVWGVRLTPPIH